VASASLSIWSLLRDLKTQEELESIQIASKEREQTMAKNVMLKKLNRENS
jgi:LAS superfamily LD-carboxypeptidase LdcB